MNGKSESYHDYRDRITRLEVTMNSHEDRIADHETRLRLTESKLIKWIAYIQIAGIGLQLISQFIVKVLLK